MKMRNQTIGAVTPSQREDLVPRPRSFPHVCIMLRLWLSVALLSAPVYAQRSVIEGYALDANGKPMPGTTVWIKSAEEKTNAGVIVAPIIGKNTIGVVGVDLGEIRYPAFITFMHADKKTGHYKFSVPGKYSLYQLSADCCDRGLFHHDFLTHSESVSVQTAPGRTADRVNLLLTPSKPE